MGQNLFVVTGASSGIGQAIAWTLAEDGHKVIACGRNEQKLATTLKKNSLIQPFIGDLSEVGGCMSLVELVKKQKDPLKGLINNAGIYDPGSFVDTSDQTWLKQFNTNLLSAVRVTRGLFLKLKDSSPCSVLNISSTLGLHPIAGTSSYSAIKAAMVNWTQCLALEWAPFKIRVNAICPGLVDTPIHPFHTLGETSQARVEAHAMQPLGRMGKSEEIAWAAEFLLSEKSAWTTGTIMPVDGGIGL